MRSGYGLDTRDPSALKVFLGLDLVATFILAQALPTGDTKAALAFWAPLLLVVLNLIVAVVVFRESSRKSITFMLGAWLGALTGMISGILYFTSDGASTVTDHEAGVIPGGLLSCWAVPVIVMMIVYSSMLRNRGE